MVVLGTLGRLVRIASEQPMSWYVDWGEKEGDGVSYVEKVSFTGLLFFLSRE